MPGSGTWSIARACFGAPRRSKSTLDREDGVAPVRPPSGRARRRPGDQAGGCPWERSGSASVRGRERCPCAPRSRGASPGLESRSGPRSAWSPGRREPDVEAVGVTFVAEDVGRGSATGAWRPRISRGSEGVAAGGSDEAAARTSPDRVRPSFDGEPVEGMEPVCGAESRGRDRAAKTSSKAASAGRAPSAAKPEGDHHRDAALPERVRAVPVQVSSSIVHAVTPATTTFEAGWLFPLVRAAVAGSLCGLSSRRT